MSHDARSAACANCGHALAKTNRGWWWCSRCERRMRLKDSVARDDLAGTMPDAGHEASEPATDASAATPSGADLIAAERQRQIDAEGWTPDHDDGHTLGELAVAGACYALLGTRWKDSSILGEPLVRSILWPWEDEWFKVLARGSRCTLKSAAWAHCGA